MLFNIYPNFTKDIYRLNAKNISLLLNHLVINVSIAINYPTAPNPKIVLPKCLNFLNLKIISLNNTKKHCFIGFVNRTF